jgi:hypothetical protein
MKLERPETRDADEFGRISRRAWTKPTLTPLRAGAAEAIPGTAISDATLETIGS